MEIPTIMCSVVGTAHSGRTTFLQALGTSPSTEGFRLLSSTEGENIKLVLSLLGTVGKRVVESQEEDRLDLSNQEPKPIVDPVQNSGDETPSMKRRKHGHCRTPSPRSISPRNTISFTNKSIAGFEKDEEGKMSTIYSFSLDNLPLSELGRTHHHNKTDFSVCRQSLPRIVIHIPPVRNESTTDKEYLENDSRLSTLSQEQQRVGIIHAEIEKGIVIDVDVFADTNPEMLSSDIQRKHRLSDEQRAELQSCVQGILRRRESRHSPAHNSEQHGTATTQPQSSTNLHRTDGATPPTSPFSSGDRRRKNTDTQNQVLFRIDVELEGGKTARVVMKKGDNAKRVADAVCVQHKLTGKSAERMTHMITGYAKLVKQKKA
ncbi:hypothetical protein BLNAU_10612 [Blattamonas nauphoetae]|uniref:Uncharacterized protein n=1 Tax=Blattamonas nauphoetae TaxID=2049346 RepID=A0ABQ9XSP2_9EUKA|nr:hypothetical protein BLNAU_10612 [Blattamonas nauphoetae]